MILGGLFNLNYVIMLHRNDYILSVSFAGEIDKIPLFRLDSLSLFCNNLIFFHDHFGLVLLLCR